MTGMKGQLWEVGKKPRLWGQAHMAQSVLVIGLLGSKTRHCWVPINMWSAGREKSQLWGPHPERKPLLTSGRHHCCERQPSGQAF